MLFNPNLQRNSAMIDLLASTEFDVNRPMGNVALCDINMIIGDWIVGLKKETENFLNPRILWLEKAIKMNETLPNENEDSLFHKCNMFKHLAIAKWLVSSKNDIIDWEHAKNIFINHYVKNSWYGKKVSKDEALNDLLPLCIEAQDYLTGINEFEKYYGKNTVSIKKKNLKPGEYGYIFCQNRVSLTYDDETIFNLGKQMLANNLENRWLVYGAFHTAAMWLEIVYSLDNKKLSSEEILIKAYDNMPNVEKPNFV